MKASNDYRWMYLLAALPTISDLIETGGLPSTIRAWVTEITMGIVMVLLVHQVRKAYAELLRLAVTDPLSGLHNRRAFVDAIEADCARSRRTHQPLSVVCIDLDCFKHVNDRAGHAEGDRILKLLGVAIQETVRANVDRGFRLGGDEFAILLPGTPTTAVEIVLERIRRRCAEAEPIWFNGPLHISAGFVEYRPPETVDEFVRRADEQMYRAKRHRRVSRGEVDASIDSRPEVTGNFGSA
jgi:diguanylate cyclase (GGDEF)-like protein